ncbi:MAG: hypothetical protein QGI75_03225 [Phycisphaerales bacterium]|nr:hypothetical protein [Phycisphaerales bacterium]MDP6891089.1 hypothetical protein [Phycisphaerales bacterium]
MFSEILKTKDLGGCRAVQVVVCRTGGVKHGGVVHRVAQFKASPLVGEHVREFGDFEFGINLPPPCGCLRVDDEDDRGCNRGPVATRR